MGEHAYAYRGHSNYGDDGWRDKTHGGSSGDQACRTVIYDSDGRKRTVVGCSPYDTECYVVETEVTEHIRGGSPVVTDYRYGPPKKVDPVRDYDYGSYGSHDKYRKPASPYNSEHRRPQDADQFLTGIQIEASRPVPPPPPAHKYRPSGYSSGYGGGGDHYKPHKSSGYGGYSSDEDGSDSDDGSYYKPGHKIRPEPNLKINGHHGGRIADPWAAAPASTHSTANNSNLSLPTNDIKEAMDFLTVGHSKNTTTEAVNPYGYKSEAVRPYGYNSRPKSPEAVRPYGYHSRQKSPEAVRPYGYNSRPKSPEAVRPYGYNSRPKSPETVKPYGPGKSGYQKPSSATGNGSLGAVIDCYEAARKYNGTVVKT